MYIYINTRAFENSHPLPVHSVMKNPRGSSQHQPSLHVCTLERDKIREKRRKGRKEKKKNGKNEKKKTKKKGETWKKNGTRRVRSILRVVVHLCYFNIREWPHYRILSANICALLGPRVYSMSKMFFFFLSLLFFFLWRKEKRREEHN